MISYSDYLRGQAKLGNHWLTTCWKGEKELKEFTLGVQDSVSWLVRVLYHQNEHGASSILSFNWELSKC